MRNKHQMYSDLADRRALTPEERADYQQNLDALGPHPNPHLPPNGARRSILPL